MPFSVTAGTADAKLKRITIGTNPAGSVYFLLGSGFAKLFQEELGIQIKRQAPCRFLGLSAADGSRRITLGVNSSLDSGMAWGGIAPYKKATKKVRSIARVWILPYAYMAKESSGIKTLADLKGKRVVVKFKTNVSLAQANRTILSTAGLTEKDVTPVESGGVVASIGMVVQGRVDAAPIATGMPQMRKAHATVPGGLRIIPVGPRAPTNSWAREWPVSIRSQAKNSKRKPFVKGDITVRRVRFLSERGIGSVERRRLCDGQGDFTPTGNSCRRTIRRCGAQRRTRLRHPTTRSRTIRARSNTTRKAGIYTASKREERCEPYVNQ